MTVIASGHKIKIHEFREYKTAKHFSKKYPLYASLNTQVFYSWARNN